MSHKLDSPCVYNIPMTLDSSGHTDGLDPHFAKTRCFDHFMACKDHIVGPMPPTKFLDRFLPILDPVDGSVRLPSKDAFRAVPREAEVESDIWEPILAALTQSTERKSHCPGFAFDAAALRSVWPTKRGFMKPQICCYTEDTVHIVRASDKISRADFGYAEFFFDVAPSPSYDLFVDPPPGADPESHEFIVDVAHRASLEEAFGQHISYVVEIFARQPRVYLYTIYVTGSRARLIRWDRAGCVITESFDIRESPEILCDFLWRYSLLTPDGRGHDVSIQPATQQDEAIFREAIVEYARSQLGESEDLDAAVRRHYEPGLVFSVTILHQNFIASEENTRRFTISRPAVTPLSLVGRGTRGYWAVDATTRQVVFLKDTWRRRHTDEVEGWTLRRLRDLGVRNTPSLVWHGDVHTHIPHEPRRLTEYDYQATETEHSASASWVCCVFDNEVQAIGRYHYRMVMGIVGRPLKTIRGARELLFSTYDVFVAMRDALAKDSRIHRDISAGNIVLVQEPGSPVRRGYLVDWESSCKVDDKGEAVDSGRTGTWRYMSIRLLRSAKAHELKHTFQDDMESLLYVVLYCALLWQPHTLTQEVLTHFISKFFDDAMVYSKRPAVGGSAKMENAYSRLWTEQMGLRSHGLRNWLDSMMNFHSPIPRREGEPNDKWADPASIDSFWADFLCTNSELELDNRVENELYTRHLKLEWLTSSTAPSVLSRWLKRGRERPSSEPPARRLRSASSKQGAVSTSPALRRSKRILEQKKKRDDVKRDGEVGDGHGHRRTTTRGTARRGRGSRLRP